MCGVWMLRGHMEAVWEYVPEAQEITYNVWKYENCVTKKGKAVRQLQESPETSPLKTFIDKLMDEITPHAAHVFTYQ